MVQTAKAFNDLFQTADYMQEKHVPRIELPEGAKKGEMFPVKVSIGSEIAHPNTTQHHIQWISLSFQPEGDKYSYEIACTEFLSHGSSVQGADTSTVYTNHAMTVQFKTDKPGTLFAYSSCNIHGLWQSKQEIEL